RSPRCSAGKGWRQQSRPSPYGAPASYRGRVRDPSISRYAAARLDPRRRASDLSRLRRQQFDVLVIGGGVTGAGAALDAAASGLSVALVEARDLEIGRASCREGGEM